MGPRDAALRIVLVLALAEWAGSASTADEPLTREYPVPSGSHPHYVAPAPDGSVYYASLAGNHITRIDPATGAATAISPPTPRQGARRVWADSKGRIWVSDFGASALVRFDPEREAFRAFPLPSKDARVRQILGRKGEVWGAESGVDRIIVIRFR